MMIDDWSKAKSARKLVFPLDFSTKSGIRTEVPGLFLELLQSEFGDGFSIKLIGVKHHQLGILSVNMQVEVAKIYAQILFTVTELIAIFLYWNLMLWRMIQSIPGGSQFTVSKVNPNVSTIQMYLFPTIMNHDSCNWIFWCTGISPFYPHSPFIPSNILIGMWVKQCQPPMTGNGQFIPPYTNYKTGDDWGMVYDCFTHMYGISPFFF